MRGRSGLWSVSVLLLPAVVGAQLVERVERVRPLYLETPFVRDGSPAVIAVDEPGLKPLGERVAQAVKGKFGITLPVRGEVRPDELAQRDIIAIGNANDNAVIKRVYGMRLCYLDAVYPGYAQALGAYDTAVGGTPMGWSFSTPTGPTHAPRLDDQVARSTPNSVRIDGTADGRGCVMRTVTNAVVGRTYTFSVWYRSAFKGGYGTLHVDAYRDQERLDLKSVPLKESADWSQASLEFTVPAGANQTRILLYLHNAGTIWYDDAQAVGPEGEDLLGGTVGRAVHTVHNPLGTGHNVIVAGGSDPAGHQAAVNDLLAVIEGLEEPVLPRLLKPVPGDTAVAQGLAPKGPDEAAQERYRQSYRKTIATNAFVPVRDRFQETLNWARNYQLTGDARHAEMYKALWRELLDTKVSHANSEMEWIFTSYEGWDMIEEDPLLSDAERLEITNRLLLIGCANERVYGRNVQRSNVIIADGHQLDQALCIWLAGFYFDRYYQINGHWKTMTQPLIDVAEESPRVHDSYAYGPIIGNQFMSEYALKSGNYGYFEKGSCRQVADWVMLCSDNLGAGGTFGDDGAWRGDVPVPLLAKAWGYYGDDRLLWFVQGRRPPLGCFATNRPAQRPDDLLGVVAAPLHQRLYDAGKVHFADAVAGRSWQPEMVPPEKAFDKLAFRSGFEPGDQYLLVDGLTAIHHGHRDGASILRFTDNGRLFLTEGHYVEIAPERHNTLVVNRDGAAWDPPPMASLEARASLPQAGVAGVLTSAYNGVDWYRCLFWRPEGFFLVVDRVTARDEGDYALTLNWQTLGDATLRDGTMTVRQDGESFSIRNADGAVCQVTEEEHRLGGNYYAGYPYCRDGLVKHLRQTRTAHLKPGQSQTFVNLLVTHQGEAAELTARVAREGLVRIEGPGGPWLAGIGPADLPLGKLDADLWFVGGDGVAVAGFRSLNGPALQVVASAPVTLGYAFASGRLQAESAAAGELRFRLGADVSTQPLTAGVNVLETDYKMDPAPWLMGLPVGAPERQTPPAAPRGTALREVAALPLPAVPNNWAAEPGCRVTSDLAPLPESTWTPDYKIALADLVTRRDAMVLWGPDQAPTITVDLGAERPLTGLVLGTMWTNNSARALMYRFDQAEVSAAASAAGPWRAAGVLRESGEPELGSKPVYTLKDLDLKARFVRLAVRPKSGAGVFLKHLEVLGPGAQPPAGVVPYGRCGGTALLAADLDGDGADEVLVGTIGGELVIAGADGKERGRVPVGGRVTALAAGELGGRAGLEVLVGTDAETLLCLESDGREVWRHEFPVFWGRQGDVRTVAAADLDGDGRNEVVVGTESWHYWCFEADGRERWRYEVLHGATHCTVADLDGDGKREVLAGHEYYGPLCLTYDGKRKYGVYGSGPWCTRTAAGDFNGDGVAEGLWAMEDDTIHGRDGQGGKPLLDVNVGGFVNDLACADLDGDKQAEIIAAVDAPTRNLICLAGDGTTRWRLDLPAAATALAVLGTGVAAGCADGQVVTVGADGAVTGVLKTDLPIAALAAVRSRAGGRLVVLSGSAVRWLAWP